MVVIADLDFVAHSDEHDDSVPAEGSEYFMIE